MVCKYCETEPLIQLVNSPIKLCKKCFFRYFERKAFRTIRKFKLIDNKDKKIGVAVSGGKDSMAVLHIINMIAKQRRSLKLVVIAVDEGIKGYRPSSLDNLKKYCKKEKLDLKIYSYKKEFGFSLDKVSKKGRPCSLCGAFRRKILNSKARELKVDKLVTGHNLDDESQTIIMNQFKRKMNVSARLGPITGVKKFDMFVQRIKPFYFLTEKEVATYSYLKGLSPKFVECPYAASCFREDVRDCINSFELKHPGTKNNIINSFVEILPVLKEKYKEIGDINYCSVCGEPCSGKICKACEYVEGLK